MEKIVRKKYFPKIRFSKGNKKDKEEKDRIEFRKLRREIKIKLTEEIYINI